MANKFWRNLGGNIVNAVLPGTPYNRYTGQYGSDALRAGLISGVIGQAAGPLGGQIAQMIQNRNPDMQAWNAGLEGWAGIHEDLSQRPAVPQMGLDVRDIGRPQGYASNFTPMYGNPGAIGNFGNNMDNFQQPQQGGGLAGGFMGDGNFNFGPTSQPTVTARGGSNIGKPTFTISGQAARDSMQSLVTGAQRAEAVSKYRSNT